MEADGSIFKRLCDSKFITDEGNIHDIGSLTGDQLLQRLIELVDNFGDTSADNHQFKIGRKTIFQILKVSLPAMDGYLELEMKGKVKEIDKSFEKTVTKNFDKDFNHFLITKISEQDPLLVGFCASLLIIFRIATQKFNLPHLSRAELARGIWFALTCNMPETIINILQRDKPENSRSIYDTLKLQASKINPQLISPQKSKPSTNVKRTKPNTLTQTSTDEQQMPTSTTSNPPPEPPVKKVKVEAARRPKKKVAVDLTSTSSVQQPSQSNVTLERNDETSPWPTWEHANRKESKVPIHKPDRQNVNNTHHSNESVRQQTSNDQQSLGSTLAWIQDLIKKRMSETN
nr:uncharacterized protein LOC100186998 isoform X3 [Ciona intestinalis]|eukprot:XP_002127042.1 uncharacterized protein LOC100186998 isoform X3 [Ciona intestinalis]